MTDYPNIHGQVMPEEMCPDVVFATPSLTHSVSKRYNRSIIQTTWLLNKHGLTAGHMDRDGDCFIAKARNKLFGDFLAQFPTTQNFFFLDDDIGWPAEKVIEFLGRPEDVIVGVYPKKSQELDFPVSLAVQDGRLVERNGLYLAILAATGFMRIRRHVIERLCAKARTFKDMEPNGAYRSYPSIFESGVGPDGLWWGEDYTFGRKWQETGGEIWVDPDIEFSHQGLNTWTGKLSDNMTILHEKAARIAPAQQLEAAE